MIVELSFKNKKVKLQIDEMLGKPYSFFQRIKMGRIGSSRMIVKEWSKEFTAFFTDSEKIKYASIELRPRGIIIHWSKNYSHFGWIIPFYKLAIFKSTLLSVHSEGKVLKMEKGSVNLSNDNFIQKILDQKASLSNQID